MMYIPGKINPLFPDSEACSKLMRLHIDYLTLPVSENENRCDNCKMLSDDLSLRYGLVRSYYTCLPCDIELENPID